MSIDKWPKLVIRNGDHLRTTTFVVALDGFAKTVPQFLLDGFAKMSVNIGINRKGFSKISVLFLTLSLAVTFYFANPLTFLENLGYSMIAVASMSEAMRLVDSLNRNTPTTANSMAGTPSNFSHARMKICRRCKKENPEEARYCLHCGLPLGP